MLDGHNVGKMDKRISIEENVGTTAPQGNEKNEDWQPFSIGGVPQTNISAQEIKEIGGENYEARQETHHQTKTWIVRIKTGITTEMRVVYNGQTFGITDITDSLNSRRYMRIKALHTDHN